MYSAGELNHLVLLNAWIFGVFGVFFTVSSNLVQRKQVPVLSLAAAMMLNDSYSVKNNLQQSLEQSFQNPSMSRAIITVASAQQVEFQTCFDIEGLKETHGEDFHLNCMQRVFVLIRHVSLP